MFDLKGKTAVITGGNRGIGRGIAHGLAQMGADIVIAARSRGATRKAVEDIKNRFNVKAMGIVTNVRDEQQINEMVREATETFGKINILVNNAGMDQNRHDFQRRTTISRNERLCHQPDTHGPHGGGQ